MGLRTFEEEHRTHPLQNENELYNLTIILQMTVHLATKAKLAGHV